MDEVEKMSLQVLESRGNSILMREYAKKVDQLSFDLEQNGQRGGSAEPHLRMELKDELQRNKEAWNQIASKVVRGQKEDALVALSCLQIGDPIRELLSLEVLLFSERSRAYVIKFFLEVRGREILNNQPPSDPQLKQSLISEWDKIVDRAMGPVPQEALTMVEQLSLSPSEKRRLKDIILSQPVFAEKAVNSELDWSKLPFGESVPNKIIFLDVVDYSTRTDEVQLNIVKTLTEIIAGCLNASRYQRDRDAFVLPTGDGFALCFLRGSPGEVADFASAIQGKVGAAGTPFQLRIGINFGHDRLYRDINGRPNFSGHAINWAARVQSKAKPGEIWLSKTFAAELRASNGFIERIKRKGPRKAKEIKEEMFLLTCPKTLTS